MNGLEKITGRITEDARAEAERILAEARAEADTVTARHEAEADESFASLKSRGERSAQERRERLRGSAELEARKLTLTTKQDLIGEAFALAGEKLSKLSDDQCVELLSKLIANAARTGKEQICLSGREAGLGRLVLPRANELVGQRGLPSKLTLSADPRDFTGGVILQDGDIEINCTYDTLLRGLRDSMASEVAGVLFN